MDDQRVERLKKIALEMNEIVERIFPSWVRLAHLRAESRQIMQELSGEAGREGG